MKITGYELMKALEFCNQRVFDIDDVPSMLIEYRRLKYEDGTAGDVAKKYNVTVGELGCKYCGTVTHGEIRYNNCMVCGKPFFEEEKEQQPEVNKIYYDEIAENYHDINCFSGIFANLICQCCGKETSSLCTIEHDTKDRSKDFNICTHCYIEIVKLWKQNNPNKILNH